MNPTFKKWEILNINMNNVHIGEENKMKVKKKNITATGQHCLADCGVQYYSNWSTQLYGACDSCEYFALSAGFCCILVDGIL